MEGQGVSIRSVDENLSVSPQIGPEDLKEIASLGFRSVVCNRPDGEAADQPLYEDIKAAADGLGLDIRYLPVVPGNFQESDVLAMAELVAGLPGPVLAYCRSGARSAQLWSMAQDMSGTGA